MTIQLPIEIIHEILIIRDNHIQYEKLKECFFGIKISAAFMKVKIALNIWNRYHQDLKFNNIPTLTYLINALYSIDELTDIIASLSLCDCKKISHKSRCIQCPCKFMTEYIDISIQQLKYQDLYSILERKNTVKKYLHQLDNRIIKGKSITLHKINRRF